MLSVSGRTDDLKEGQRRGRLPGKTNLASINFEGRVSAICESAIPCQSISDGPGLLRCISILENCSHLSRAERTADSQVLACALEPVSNSNTGVCCPDYGVKG